jgi:outer membrane protein assembly factor BamB
MAWFGVGPSIVAVAVAPLSPGAGHVAALDPSTGYERWHYAVPSGAFPPALTSHAVIFGTVDGTVWALDESSADVLWTASFPGIPFQVIAADGAIVVADADPALWGADGLIDKTRLAGRVWGLDPVTGAKLWTIDTDSQQAFVAAADGAVVISTSDSRVGAKTETMAVDSKTGERLWEKPTDSASSPPTISGTAVYVATSTGKLLALNLGTGDELWTVSSTDGTNYQIPAVVGNALLAPSTANTLDARDPSTGSLLWTNTIAGCPAHASGPSKVFETGNQTFVLACEGLYTVGGAGQQPTPWIIPQGGFEWVTPIPHGVLGSSYTGEGPVGLMALGVD